MGSGRDQISSNNEPIIFFFVVVGLFMFGFLACSREEKEWEIKR